MKEYVLVYANPIGLEDNFLMILRDRPLWQKSRFNLIGGKIEENESPEQCAVREMKEESGLDPIKDGQIKVRGKIIGDWGIVHVVEIPVFYKEPEPRPEETEKVFWTTWREIKDSPNLINNLKVILPLLSKGLSGWTISDHETSTIGRQHTFEVTI